MTMIFRLPLMKTAPHFTAEKINLWNSGFREAAAFSEPFPGGFIQRNSAAAYRPGIPARMAPLTGYESRAGGSAAAVSRSVNKIFRNQWSGGFAGTARNESGLFHNAASGTNGKISPPAFMDSGSIRRRAGADSWSFAGEGIYGNKTGISPAPGNGNVNMIFRSQRILQPMENVQEIKPGGITADLNFNESPLHRSGPILSGGTVSRKKHDSDMLKSWKSIYMEGPDGPSSWNYAVYRHGGEKSSRVSGAIHRTAVPLAKSSVNALHVSRAVKDYDSKGYMAVPGSEGAGNSTMTDDTERIARIVMQKIEDMIPHIQAGLGLEVD